MTLGIDATLGGHFLLKGDMWELVWGVLWVFMVEDESDGYGGTWVLKQKASRSFTRGI